MRAVTKGPKMSGVFTLESPSILNDCSDRRLEDAVTSSGNGQEIRLSLPSNRRVIAPVIVMLREIADAVGILSDREQMSVSVALEEALTNAVVHGNLEVSSKLRDLEDDSFEEMIAVRLLKSPFGDRRVEVTARYTNSEASFTISDEGPGFDVMAVPDPTDEENICLTHGRGLFLMRSFMDEVIHNAVGNQVTLVKRKPHLND